MKPYISIIYPKRNLSLQCCWRAANSFWRRLYSEEKGKAKTTRRGGMPEESTAIDYVMEKASGPHFSGLRLESLRSSSPSSSPRASSTPTVSSASILSAESTAKQPFVIGMDNPNLFWQLMLVDCNFSIRSGYALKFFCQVHYLLMYNFRFIFHIYSSFPLPYSFFLLLNCMIIFCFPWSRGIRRYSVR